MSHRPRAPSLRQVLRDETRNAHATLESTPLMQAFASGQATYPEYCDYLTRQLHLHRALEGGLRPRVPTDWSDLRLSKAEWLAADLRALGAAVDERCVEVPEISGWPSALGALYVLEGSTLGLEIVRRRLRADHPAAQSAGRFVAGYGESAARHWRSFLAALESLPEQDWPPAADTARATFAAFHRIFSE